MVRTSILPSPCSHCPESFGTLAGIDEASESEEESEEEKQNDEEAKEEEEEEEGKKTPVQFEKKKKKGLLHVRAHHCSDCRNFARSQ